MWRWVVGGAVALLLAFGIVAGVAVRTSDGGWVDTRWDDDDRVERIVAADGTETLVVHDVRNHGFPLGILFVPLVIFGIFALARAVFGHGRGGPGRWGGPGGWGGPGAWGGHAGPPWAYGGSAAPAGPGDGSAGAGQAPAAPPWFEEWHRRTHEAQTSADSTMRATPAAANATEPVAPPSPAVD